MTHGHVTESYVTASSGRHRATSERGNGRRGVIVNASCLTTRVRRSVCSICVNVRRYTHANEWCAPPLQCTTNCDRRPKTGDKDNHPVAPSDPDRTQSSVSERHYASSRGRSSTSCVIERSTFAIVRHREVNVRHLAFFMRQSLCHRTRASPDAVEAPQGRHATSLRIQHASRGVPPGQDSHYTWPSIQRR